MSNVAGKAYGMNVLTPLRWWTALWQKLIFWVVVKTFPYFLNGLLTLSLIHYARWTIINRWSFPRLDKSQPKEKLTYSYMLFESNFNGSWDQYIDSFSFAIPSGLDMFWRWNIKYPKSIPLHDFYNYIRFNQIESGHYYNAYPLAAANDVKTAQKLFTNLNNFQKNTASLSDEEFFQAYQQFLASNQHNLGSMGESPLMSASHELVQEHQHANLMMARVAGKQEA
ncbi:hypothetical protein [Thalassolituus sp. UBA2009]|uniref:hypothetical protein n=1 Tax=Thalassolituus sp. UBA2009 TaxID=1947658 RepID=UPI000C3B08C9|nr:hypothetical protein [Thalassolituus sp. UBA2009]MAY16069.1 hypothetical protein [Oceanospirillaceae bacterium]